MFALIETSDGRLGALPYVESSSPQEPAGLVLDATASIDLRLTEAGAAREGVSCTFRFEEFGHALRPEKVSGADGVVRFEKLAPGGYWVDLDGGDIVPDSVLVQAGSASQSIEVWSRTKLTLQLVHEDGMPSAGVPIQLSHGVLGGMVAEGIADGTITTSTGSMQTDPSGQLVIEGLARGSYTWTVGAISGLLDVSPEGTGLTLFVP
jgi:hypothetical protein